MRACISYAAAVPSPSLRSRVLVTAPEALPEPRRERPRQPTSEQVEGARRENQGTVDEVIRRKGGKPKQPPTEGDEMQGRLDDLLAQLDEPVTAPSGAPAPTGTAPAPTETAPEDSTSEGGYTDDELDDMLLSMQHSVPAPARS